MTVEAALWVLRTFSRGSSSRMVRGWALHSKRVTFNSDPRILNKVAEGLTTTGSEVRGSPRSGRLIMINITEPRLVPTRQQADNV